MAAPIAAKMESHISDENIIEDKKTMENVEKNIEVKEQEKHKEDKGQEHILKALNSLQTSEEKLAALCKKYSDLYEEHRIMQNKFKQSQKKITAVAREKEQIQTEHTKSVLAKNKLESVCRELQRHNKLIKEESMTRMKEEEEKRKEVTTKFQTTINDIQQQMNDHYSKNTKLREENIELANKLQHLIEQYETREQHIEKVFKHKDLEKQLLDAKLAQANLRVSEEKEKNLQEKQILLTDASQSQKQIESLENQERHLKAQVQLYTDKYEEFQQTLAKSNEVFQSFKSEMDKMTKKIKKLEKETMMWKTRWENSNKALLDMAEEKTRNDKEMGTLQNKIQRLEKLCRALQAERHKTPEEGPQVLSQDEASSTKPQTENSLTKTPPNTPSVSRSSPVPPEETTVQTRESQNTTPSQSALETALEKIHEEIKEEENIPEKDQEIEKEVEKEALVKEQVGEKEEEGAELPKADDSCHASVENISKQDVNESEEVIHGEPSSSQSDEVSQETNDQSV